MPYYNLNHGYNNLLAEEYDFVIIGGGIAGILMAVNLTKKGKKVIIFESGHFSEDPNRQSLNEVVQSGKYLSNAVWGRKRAIGGTSIAWGGQSLPFSKLDFQKRDWVDNSGWPISFEHLEPYYLMANRFMNVDQMDYDKEMFDFLKIKKIEFNPNLLKYHFSKWAPQPNFKLLYDADIKKNIPLFYNANITKIVYKHNEESELEIMNFSNDSFKMKFNKLIIATGAIEANRILLSNNIFKQDYSKSWLGKCFMDHPCIEIGKINSENSYILQKHFNTHYKKRRKYSLRISLSEKAQIENKLLNASSSLMFDYADDTFNPYTEIKTLVNQRKLSSIFSITKNSNYYFKSLFALLNDNLVYKHNATGKLVVMMEQEPQKNSCIKLSKETDVFGVPKAEIDWRISSKTWETLLFLCKSLNTEFHRLSLGQIKSDLLENNSIKNWENRLSDVNHHMGGTRMSSLPDDGVVNTNLEVWDYEKIIVCSSSVFPTGSHSNPTLTLMALCFKLLENID